MQGRIILSSLSCNCFEDYTFKVYFIYSSHQDFPIITHLGIRKFKDLLSFNHTHNPVMKLLFPHFISEKTEA